MGVALKAGKRSRKPPFLAQRRHAPRELAESWIHLGLAHLR
jgi:hypothetical protein